MKLLTNYSQPIITYSFLLLVFFTPLIFYEKSFELFEFNKMMFVYLMTIIIVTFWVFRMIKAKKLLFEKTPLDIPLALFLLANILATLFSIDTHTSIFGYYSRLNGGLLSIISYVLLYYAFMANFPREKIKQFLTALLFGGVIVSLWAIPEHFGIDPSCKLLVDSWSADCWVQDVKARVFATIGQPNWLAAYLGMIIPVSLGFLLHEKEARLKWVYLVTTLLMLLAFIFTFSRGGTLGLAVGLVFFVTLLFFSNAKIGLPEIGSKKPLISLIIITTLLVLIFGTSFSKPLNLFKPAPIQTQSQSAPQPSSGSQLESGGTETGQIRLIVWKGALDIWKHYPIFGSGVETFAYSYYQFRPVAHNQTSEWDFLYNKAHNEYLNYLATTGTVGLFTYLFLIVSFFLFVISKLRNSSPHYRFVVIGLLSAQVVYLVQNFFSFSVVIIALLFYLYPAITFKLLGDKEEATWLMSLRTVVKQSLQKLSFSTRSRIWIPAFAEMTIRLPRSVTSLAKTIGSYPKLLLSITLLISFILVYLLSRLYLADLKFADGFKAESELEPTNSRYLLEQAVLLNPLEPFYQTELGQVNALLASSAETEEDRQKYTEEALFWGKKAVLSSPKVLNYYRTLLSIYIELLDDNPSLAAEAVAVAQLSAELAPTEPKVLYNLGALYSRLGEYAKAIQTTKRVTQIKPDYREAYLILARSYEDNKQRSEAIAVYKDMRHKFPQETEAKVRLEQWTGSEDGI